MSKHPQIENTPGLTWRKLAKDRWEARWRARPDLIQKGFLPKNARLWVGTEAEIDDIVRKWLSDASTGLQDEMIVYGQGVTDPVRVVYGGTWATLIDCYQTDPDSTYRKVRYATRGYYDRLCKRIRTDIGHHNVADTKARQLIRLHEIWGRDGKVAMAHSVMGMLRTLVNFGATFLEDRECQRLATALSGMKFKQGSARTERLTAEHAIAVRTQAHANGRASLALAQAIQFDLMLRQKDVIGEWVPISEPGGPSAVIHGNAKWTRGLRWDEIDANLTLRHTTSKRQKEIAVNLRQAPMVMEELTQRFGVGFTRDDLPASGPIIVQEKTDLPYSAIQFRKVWRELATAAGVPATVRNMDSRAGAITEATDAGADLESVRHAATHSDIGMTQRYSRGGEGKTAQVMQLRAEFRAKKGGGT